MSPPALSLIRNPDLAPVAELMVRTWARPCWKYTAELLEGYIRRPTGDPALSAALLAGDDVAAYQALVPYRLRYGDALHDVVQGAFWTANPRHADSGAGLRILRELLRLAREEGYAGFLAMTERGSLAGRMLMADQQRRGLRLLRTFRQFVGRPGRLRGTAETPPPRYSSASRAGCAALFAGTGAVAELAKCVPEADVDFVLAGRAGSVTWTLGQGSTVRGLVNVLRAEMLHPQGTKVTGILESVLFGDVDADERRAFLRTVFSDRFWSDVELVSAPAMGYADDELRAIGLIEALQCFDLYYMPFADGPAPHAVGPCYLDLL